MHEQPLWRFLEAVADFVVVGLLTTLACLPVVTAPAALSAAGAVLADADAGGALARRYLVATRARLRRGVVLAALAGPLLVVAAVDIAWSLGAPLTALRTGVLAAGVLLAVSVSAVAATATSDLAAGGSLPAATRRAAYRAVAAPGRAVLPVLTALAGAAVVTVAPIVTPAVLALIAKSLPTHHEAKSPPPRLRSAWAGSRSTATPPASQQAGNAHRSAA